MSTIAENRRSLDQMRALHLDPNRVCSKCVHKAKSGNCGKPVEAGLSTRFEVLWADDEWVQTKCRAFEARRKSE